MSLSWLVFESLHRLKITALVRFLDSPFDHRNVPGSVIPFATLANINTHHQQSLEYVQLWTNNFSIHLNHVRLSVQILKKTGTKEEAKFDKDLFTFFVRLHSVWLRFSYTLSRLRINSHIIEKIINTSGKTALTFKLTYREIIEDAIMSHKFRPFDPKFGLTSLRIF